MATSSINPGLANLLQNLSNVGSPLLSSPQAVAALQKASPADIVQLSAEATQLEGLNALLGVASPGGTTSDGTTIDPFASLEAEAASASPTTGTAPSSSATSTPSLAAALASYEGNAQAGETAALFGTDIGASSPDLSSLFG